MYWLLCASTVWNTGLASAKRLMLTDPPVAPDAAAEAGTLAAALGAADAAAVGAADGAAEAGAWVAGVDEHAPSTNTKTAVRLRSFLRIPTPLRLSAAMPATSGCRPVVPPPDHRQWRHCRVG